MNELFSDSDKKEIDNLINEEKAINLQPEGQDKRRAKNTLKQKIKAQEIEATIGFTGLNNILSNIQKCELNTENEEAVKLFQNKANNRESLNLHEWHRVSELYNLYSPMIDDDENGWDTQNHSTKNIIIFPVYIISVIALNICRLYAISDEYITLYMSAVNSIALLLVIISITQKSYCALHNRIVNSHKAGHRKKDIDKKILVSIIIFDSIVCIVLCILYIIKLRSNLWNDVISIVALLSSLCDYAISSILTILFSWKYKIPKLMLGVEENEKTSYD